MGLRLGGMIQKIVPTPGAVGGRDGELYAKLAEILQACVAARPGEGGSEARRPQWMLAGVPCRWSRRHPATYANSGHAAPGH